MQKSLALKFEKISFSVFLCMLVILPFVFLPGTLAGMAAVKGVILSVGVFSALVLWLIASFIEGSIGYIRSRILLALLVLTILSLVSALSSANTTVSLWGRGFAIDSFATTLVLAIAFFLTAIYTQNKFRLRTLLFSIFFSGAATMFLQCILFFARKLPFIAKFFSSVTTGGTLIGSWTEFSFYSAFIFTFSLLIFELFRPKGLLRYASITSAIVALVTLIFLNFTLAWLLVLIVSLLIFIYKMSVERSLSFASTDDEKGINGQTTFPFLSFAALLVGIFFLISSGSIGASLSRFAGTTFTDIRPSVGVSLHLARASLLHDPLFGVGSGRYGSVYDLYHPTSINATSFWNTTFENGYNDLLTRFVTLGALPTVAFIVLFVLLIILAVRIIGKSMEDRSMRFMTIATTVLFILLFCSTLLAFSGFITVTLLFVLGGILVGTSVIRNITTSASVHFLNDPRTSFFAVTGMTIVILIASTSVYLSATRFASIIIYNRALGAKDIPTAIKRLSRADSLSHNDLFYRTSALLSINAFTAESQSRAPQSTILQGAFSVAEQNAKRAVAWDTTNASNWYVLGQVYQLAAGPNNEDAGKRAIDAYTTASTFRPQNPLFFLSLAQIGVLTSDQSFTSTNLEKAKSLKVNYLDAYIFEAQLKQSQGDASGAVSVIESYISHAPNDDEGYGILGMFLIAQKDYAKAEASFKEAYRLNPSPSYALFYIKTLLLQGNPATVEKEQFKKQFPDQISLLDNLSQLLPSIPDESSSSDLLPSTDSTSLQTKKTPKQ